MQTACTLAARDQTACRVGTRLFGNLLNGGFSWQRKVGRATFLDLKNARILLLWFVGFFAVFAFGLLAFFALGLFTFFAFGLFALGFAVGLLHILRRIISCICCRSQEH